MKKTFVVPPSLSVGPKKWLKNAIIGIGGLILVCSPVSAAGLMGPNASAIPTKSVGDSLRITDFNALLDVARKLFVDEKTAGTADDLVGLGTYTADTGTCPAGTTHVDFNDNTTVEAGECFSGVAVVDGNLGIGTLSPSNPLSVRVDNSLQTATARIFNNGVGDSTLLFANQAVGVHLGIDNSDSDKFKISTSETDIAGGTNLLTITQTGAVGMGTITPSEKLDVAGNIAVTGTVDGVDVSVLATTVGTNTAGIATNAGNITTNTNNITTNETGIATNITNIAANVTDIATNVADIATNLENIGINTGAIGTKANLVTGATAGNIAGLDVDGNLTDSGLKRNDLGTATTDLWSADKIQSAITAGVGTVTEADTLGTVTARGKSTSTGINLNGTLNDLSKGLTFGDADTGFYESVDDTLRFVSGGSLIWTFSDTILGSGATGEPSLRNEVASSTNPNILSNNADSDTGIGSAGDNQLSLIAGGVEGIRVNTATTGVNYLDVTPSATTDAVQIGVGGTDVNIDLALMPKGTGNVGIGTTNPEAKLDVRGNMDITTTGSALGTGINLIKSGVNDYNGVNFYDTESLTWSFGENSAGFGLFEDGAAAKTRLIVKEGGSVGIGDTTPDGTLKLDVEGQIGSTGYCDENGANCKTIVELSDTGSDNQTLDEVLTSGATTTRTITSGNILPEMTGATGSISTRTLGSDTAWFSDLYADEVHIGANSLYVNGKKVIHDESDTMTFTTDIDQNVKMYTAGTGGLTLESKDTGNLYLKKSGTNGNLQIESSTNATISAVSGISLTIPNSAPAGNHIYLTNSDTDGKIYLNASGISLTSSTAVDVQAGLSATGAITGASFNGVTLADGGSGALTVIGVTSISGSNTGDETTATIKSKLGAATTSTDGYLTSADWNTFNSKQAALTNPVTGTGTTNYLTKFTGTSAVGNSLVFDNGTNVGIGTTNPSTNLHINGGTNAYIKLTDTDSGETATDGFKIGIDSSEQASLWNYENTDMQLATNGALRVVIDSSGNVGIGTDTSPDYLLDVQGTFHADGEASFDGNIAVSGTVDGVDVAGLSTTVGTKADKVFGATSGNLAGLDASGNLTDSGLVLNDTGSTVNDIWSGSKITAAISSGVGEVVEVDTLDSVTDRGATTTNAITTGGLTVDTDTLFVDATNNRVGVGTTVPGYKLQIDSTSAGAESLGILVKNSDATDGVATGIGFMAHTGTLSGKIVNERVGSGDYSMKIGPYGNFDAVSIRTSGNVGIGTTTPYSRLSVVGGDSYTEGLTLLTSDYVNGSTGSRLGFKFGADTGDTYSVISAFQEGSNATANLVLNDVGGNVGIGTTSPASELEVKSKAADNAYIYVNTTTADYDSGVVFQESGSSKFLIGTSASNDAFRIFDYSTGASSIVVKEGGNVGIGTTTPTETLDVAGGLRVDNNEWLSARDSAGTGVVNMFRATTDGSIELGAPLLLGALTADTDSGAVSIFNMPVSGVATAGSEMSASVQLDSENIFKIYSEADGTGGIQNQSVQVSGDVFAVQYCDENGANCKTVSELSDSGTDDQTLTWTDATNILGITDGNTVEITGFQASNTHLDDLADGTLSSSVLDSDLQDLADGSLSGSKVGTGISGTNITTGTVADARIASTITRDSEWNTQAEVETIWGTTLATDSELALKSNIASPTFTGTVSGITSAMVGLGNVTNESKATMFTSPSFTGIPTAPTATSGTSTTQLATTAFVTSAITTATPAAQTLTWTDATNILGISGGNTVEVTGFQAADADLDDLADGSLSGSKVGTGISGTNITTGTVADARIASTITRDSEWNTQGEVETIWGTTLATDSELTTGLSGKLDKNTAITAGTHTKITYDVDGLVTAGSNATTADIAESGNLYFTNARAITAVGGAKNDTGTGTSDFWSASKIQTAISSSVVTEVDTLATVTGRDATTTEVLTVAGIVTAGTVDGVDVSELNNSVDTNTTAITTKADKVLSATAGHIAGLDVDGNLTDSGLALNDSGSSTTDLWSADKIGLAITTATPAAQTLTWTDATNILGISGGNTVAITGFQAADADLTDLADGSLTGSKVGTGISATNVTTGTLPNSVLDADLQDLADGSLTGSKVGSGISGTNITTGTVADARIASTITRDSEWNTQGEVETIWGTTLATDSELALKANIASPTFTGAPKAPTATAGTNSTQLATTAFVTAAVTSGADTDWVESGGDVYRASGNVGIGTNDPSAKLHVNGNDSTEPWILAEGGSGIFDNIGLRLYDKGTSGGNSNVIELSHYNGIDASIGARILTDSVGTNMSSGAKLILETAADNADTLNSNQLVLSNDGNVGIGTASPATKLDVNGSIRTNASIQFGDGDSSVRELVDDILAFRANGIDSFYTSSGSTQAGNSNGWQLTNGGSSATAPNIIPNRADANTGLGSAGTDIVSLIAGGVNGLNVDGSGNVGIGTTSPGAKLDVNSGSSQSAAKFTAAAVGVFNDFQSATGTGRLGFFSQNVLGLAYGTGTTPHLAINSSGNVGIGTTTPGTKLHVNVDTVNSEVLRLDNPSARDLIISSYFSGGDDAGTEFYKNSSIGEFKFSNTSLDLMTIKSDGNVGIGITTPSQKLDIAGGLRVDNDSWLSARDTAGTGFVNMFKVNTNDEIEVGGQLNIGTLGLAEDSGAVTFVNMPVSSTPTAGVEESFSFSLDSTPVLKVYSEADGSGGIQNTSVQVDGAVHANGFCDETGANCKTIAELSNTGSDDQTLTWTDSTNTLVISGGNSQVISGFQASDADLTDLADGSLTGSKVGTGIAAGNITTGTLPNSVLDADLQDLADGSLTGSKVGSGISGTNITTGTVADARIASTITRDSEWNTQAEVETVWGTTLATDSELALKANIANPLFTGIPKAPTATAGTNSMQLATTAFVTAAVSSGADTDWVESGGNIYRASGNVGIGDANPSFPLDVTYAGSRIRFKASTGNSDLELSSTEGSDWLVRSKSDGKFELYDEDSAASRFLIDTSGNVGIGTTTPLSKLHINGGVGTLATGLTFGDGDSGFFESIDDTLQIYTAGTAKWNFAGNYFSGASTGGAKLYQAAASSTQPAFMFSGDENTGIGHAGADQISLIANATEIVNVATTGITVNGNIAVTGTVDGVDISTLSASVTTNTSGIATNVSGIADNVTAIASNADNIAINTGVISGKADMVTGATAGNLAGLDGDGNLTDSGLKLNDSGTSTTDMWSASKINSAITAGADTDWVESGGNVYRASGNVGIGIASPSARAHIYSNTADMDGLYIQKYSDEGNYALRVKHETAAASRYIADFQNNNGSVLLIRGDGNVGIGTTTPDYKLQVAGDIVPETNNASTLGKAALKWGGLFTASIVDDGSDVEFNNEIIVERSATAANASSSNQTILGVTDTSAARTITLATADNVDGRIIIIKDESGGASTNNITIVTEGSQTIDGAASIAITADYGVLRVYSNGTNWFSF